MARHLLERFLSFTVGAFLVTPLLAPALAASPQGCVPTGTATKRISYETLPNSPPSFEWEFETCEDGSTVRRWVRVITYNARTRTYRAQQMMDPVTGQLCPPVTSLTLSAPFSTGSYRSVASDPVPGRCPETHLCLYREEKSREWETESTFDVTLQPFQCPSGDPGMKQTSTYERLGRFRVKTVKFYFICDPVPNPYGDAANDIPGFTSVGDWTPWIQLEYTTTVVTNCVGWPNINPFSLEGEDGESSSALGTTPETTQSSGSPTSPAGLDFWLQLGRLGTAQESAIPGFSNEQPVRVVFAAAG